MTGTKNEARCSMTVIRGQALRVEEDETAIEAACNRVENATLAGKTPAKSDLDAALLCRSCWGFGYYHEDEDRDDQTTCRSCGGDGLAANHPNKGK